MKSWLALSITVVLVLASVALGGEPTLRTAGASKGHIVVAFSPGELVPGEVAVAVRATRTVNGSFVRANVRLLEPITAKADRATGIVRFRTHGTVRRGVYYVAVSGFLQEPPPSCVPIASHCAERWSNVRRVVVVGTASPDSK
jgi:hypothetical protein